MQFHTKPFKLHQTFLKKEEGGGMKVKRGGEREVWWTWEEKRMGIADEL